MIKNLLGAAALLMLLGAAPVGAVELPLWGTVSFRLRADYDLQTPYNKSAVINLLPVEPLALKLTGSFAHLEPLLVFQNMGQTFLFEDLGVNSNLACGLDCLFTVGDAEFHVDWGNTFRGGEDCCHIFRYGTGTFVMPGFDPITHTFALSTCCQANHAFTEDA